MLQDPERYILTTANLSVMRDVLTFLLEEVKSEGAVMPGAFPSLEAVMNAGCDRMTLELRRPKEPASDTSPRVRKLRTSRLGRVLVATGEATVPELLQELDTLRRSHFPIQHLTSGLLTFVRTLSCTLQLADHQN